MRMAACGEGFAVQRKAIIRWDPVKPETERINSRFLETTGGAGDFCLESSARRAGGGCASGKSEEK